ncbi:MAG: hypothetical protein K0S75_557 [Clostridia bacterium]|jgi:uncharacterized YkwD family protein/spore coat assembly protein SafA|nr:hypothetical protein [Clostridia bacterium]
MKKLIISFVIVTAMLVCIVSAQETVSYTVVSGDSMWKIAEKYQVGVSEIISSNPGIKNPSMIYPGQKLIVPTMQGIKSLESQVVKLVNAERAKQGLQPLTENWQLSRVARYKSADMAAKNYFSHTSPTYGSPFRMMESFGIKYSSAGENIAYGQKTPQSVMTAWMNSPGHRSNIMSPSYTQIGVGYATNKGGTPYWTQMFIRPTR